MLTLSIDDGDFVTIGDTIVTVFRDRRNDKMKIGIDARKEHRIYRMDILQDILRENGYELVYTGTVSGESRRAYRDKNSATGKVVQIMDTLKNLLGKKDEKNNKE